MNLFHKFSFLFCFLLFSLLANAQINRPIGINLSGVEDWSEEFVFVDVMKQARQWVTHDTAGGSAWSTNLAVPMGANGYPLQVPFTVGASAPQQVRTLFYAGELNGLYPAGMYRLQVSGSGRVRLWGGASGVFNCPVDTLVSVNNTSGLIALEIEQSLQSNPIHDIHFVMPGHHTTYQTNPFYPALLDFLQDFQCIRFMDWMSTNGNPMTTWSERTRPNSYTQTRDQGVAYEYIVDLCNQLQKDAWICVPHAANDNFITKMARLFRDDLDPNLKIYIEYSNETWNGIFPQNQYGDSIGNALGYGGQPWDRTWKYTAKRSADIFQIFENEFVDDSRFIKVVASQAANSWVTNFIMERFSESQYNPTGVTADAIAIAPYYGGVADDFVNANTYTSATVSDILDSMEYSLPESYQWMDDHLIVADTFNVDLIAYEGGQHLVTYQQANDTAWVNKLKATQRDPRIQNQYCNYFSHWYDSTQAGLFCHFSSHGNWGRYGFWGTKENYADILSPKYVALQQCVFSQNTDPTSVRSISKLDDKLSVYPNPSASGVFNVSFENNKIKELNVYSLQGKKIPFLQRQNAKGIEIIISDAAGTYILQAAIHGGFAHQKLVVK